MSATDTSTITLTMSEAVERFLADAEADIEHGGIRRSTLKEYARTLRGLLVCQTAAGWRLGDLRYTKVTAVEVKAALHAYAKTVGKPRAGMRLPDGSRRMSEPKRPAPATVARTRAAIGTVFRVTDMALGIDRPSPVRGLRMRDVLSGRSLKPERPKRYLTVDQQERLVAKVTDAHRRIVRLVLLTGLRSAEVRGLLAEDLDLDAAVPTLRVTGQATEHGGRVEWTKSETSRREIPLVPEAVAVIREQAAWVERVHGTSPLLFPTSTSAEKTHNGTNVWRSVQKAAGRAGIPRPLSVHDLRHSAAKTWLHEGVPLDVVSQLLGHSDPSITAAVYLAAEVSNEEKLAALMRARSASPTGEASSSTGPDHERSSDGDPA